jgi:hypothetical protein
MFNPKFKRDDHVRVITSGRMAVVCEYMRFVTECVVLEPSPDDGIRVVIRYLNDPDPHNVAFVKEERLERTASSAEQAAWP